MGYPHMKSRISALRVTAGLLGITTGLYGVEHSYFEALQGNVAPSAVLINAVSPPCLPYPLGCEPAMTFLPSYLLTGILAMSISLVVIVWSTFFVQRRNGGVILILLSILQVLLGGGLAPIFGGIFGGIAGTKIDSPSTWWRAHLGIGNAGLLAKLWPWSLAIYLLWVPAELVLGYVFGASNPILASLPSIPIPVVFLLLAVLGGISYDIRGFPLHGKDNPSN